MPVKDKKNEYNTFSNKKLLETLLEMLEDTPLSAISISELTQRAGVSRMTFYRHYSKTEDILIFRLHEIMEQYWHEDNINIKQDKYYDKKYLMHCFSYFYKYREFLEGLINSGLGDLYLEALATYINLKWEIPENHEEKVEVTAFTGLLFNIYKFWINEKYRTSVEDMATIVEKFCSKGIGNIYQEI